MSRRLSAKQKRINKAEYRAIRDGWLSVKDIDGITYMQYKHNIQATKVANNLSTKDAIKKFNNTERFVSAAERSRFNLIESIKERFKDEYNEIRYKSRDDKGKLKAVKDNLTWDTQRGGYVLASKWFIDITNSPEEINIYEI